MKIRHMLSAAAAASLVAAAALACADADHRLAPTAPVADLTAPKASETPSTSVFWPCRVKSSFGASQVVGPAGGTLKFGSHSLSVPQGALDRDVTIRVTVPAGEFLETEFEPHGLVFAKPAALTLSYRGCSVMPPSPLVVYTDGGVLVLEDLPSWHDGPGKRVTGQLWHFSHYVLAD